MTVKDTRDKYPFCNEVKIGVLHYLRKYDRHLETEQRAQLLVGCMLLCLWGSHSKLSFYMCYICAYALL
jgi:hypothetical protein